MNNIGKLIVKLREKHNISQEELANQIYSSRTYISLVENGQRTLSQKYIIPMSRILNFNFLHYFQNSHKYNNIDHYLLACKLIKLLDVRDYEQISVILNTNKHIKEFNYGSALIINMYTQALVEIYLNDDYDKAEEIIMSVLNINDKSEISNFKPVFHDEERYFSCINLLSTIQYHKGDDEVALMILNNLIDFMEDEYFNNELISSSISLHFRKLHIAALNNCSELLFKRKDLPAALAACDKTLDFITNYELNYAIEQAQKLKIKILYKLDRIDEAQELYEHFKVVCEIKSRIEYFNETNELIELKYPKLKTSSI